MIYKNCLKNAFLLLCVVFLAACEEPYTPEVLEGQNNFLVVSGFINSNGPTTIRLSRTQNLSESGGPVMEQGATVQVEEENGIKFPLLETNPGTYSSNFLPLISSKRYRLVIKTAGKDYASDYVEVKQTPSIDNVTWKAESDGLQIFVSTHDVQNKTRYYRWEYEETWEYSAFYYSGLEYVNGEMRNRAPENSIYLCWRNFKSSNINLGNTVKLSQDVVSNFPLIKVPSNSDKIDRKYSILVKQYAQSKESYEYYEALKKNTESIGTLFDPLPTQLTGNIHSVSAPSEPVIGFINISSVTEKRIFVSRSELPLNWGSPRMFCTLDTVLLGEESTHFNGGYNIPIHELLTETNVLIGYASASRPCGDCRVYGVNVKPDFWQ
ncbi:DUF4249 domain-containing protein [Sabulibacter ruber]|uniref:DUF4249 domain-containing protein n=1 Tax=Sabulibacter ruber TaxID=2811901 RepID=UPI001A96A8E7|nr:DUF4249 domain-containing protein [Sabulibacter ruber]